MEKFHDDRKKPEYESNNAPRESESSLADQVLAINETDRYWEIARRAGFKDAYDDGEYLVVQTFTPDRSQVKTIKIYDNKHDLCFEADFAAMKERAERAERQKSKKKDASIN